jgi:hypothetical protein
MSRQRLQNRHQCESFNFTHGGMGYVASVGRYADGRLAEVFISNHKSGSDSDAASRDSAFSLACRSRPSARLCCATAGAILPRRSVVRSTS